MYGVDKACKILKSPSIRLLNSELDTIRKVSSNATLFSRNVCNYLPFHQPKHALTLIASIRHRNHIGIQRKDVYSTSPEEELVDANTFERVCEETLLSLADYFDDLVATEPQLEKADVIYGVGVLTIDLGRFGTYVINRQLPNKQIWLSSPTSGPKRFDYVVKEDCWVYKHDGQTLHSLLKKEFESIIGKEMNLSNCCHSDLRE